MYKKHFQFLKKEKKKKEIFGQKEETFISLDPLQNGWTPQKLMVVTLTENEQVKKIAPLYVVSVFGEWSLVYLMTNKKLH